MLKRTERLIDAVKLIHLLETMEGKDAELTIKKTGDIWEINYKVNGLSIKDASGNLSDMVERTIAFTRKQEL